MVGKRIYADKTECYKFIDHEIYKKDGRLRRPIRGRDLQIIKRSFKPFSAELMKIVKKFLESKRCRKFRNSPRISLNLKNFPELSQSDVIQKILRKLQTLSRIQKETVKYDGVKINIYQGETSCKPHQDRAHRGKLQLIKRKFFSKYD